MRAYPSVLGLLVVLCTAVPAPAEDVPFKAVYAGQAVSAVPTSEPGVLLVTTMGGGHSTLLGKYSMVAPHLTNLVTLAVEGEQHFTAANGDTLSAAFTGQFQVIDGGFLAASIACTITGGTGRLAGASGQYVFDIIFDPATLQDRATIRGTVHLPDGD